MLRSDDMEVRYGNVWCQTALNTRFWCAWTDWQGFWPWCLMSKMWITGSAEPDDTYQPSGDHDWLIRADWDSLLSCFQPNAWTSVCLSLTSNKRSCLPGVLLAQRNRRLFKHASQIWIERYWQPLHFEHHVLTIYINQWKIFFIELQLEQYSKLVSYNARIG
jgi:hypothetical protein